MLEGANDVGANGLSWIRHGRFSVTKPPLLAASSEGNTALSAGRKLGRDDNCLGGIEEWNQDDQAALFG